MEYASREVLLKKGKMCVIRRAEERDAEALARFQRETAGETPYLIVGAEDISLTAEEQAERITRWNNSADRLRLLAEVDGELAGAALVYGSGVQPRLRHRCGVDITVYRKFWRMGVGTVLMEELLEAAESAGYEQAELETVSGNKAAAGLYQKLGFETIGTIPHGIKYSDGTYADFLYMVKRLV